MSEDKGVRLAYAGAISAAPQEPEPTTPAVSVEARETPAPPIAPGTASCKCGAPPHATDPARCAKGHTCVGNPLAVSTAFDARALPPELAHLDAEVQDFMTGCLVDEADPDVPTRRKALLTYRARLHRRIVQLDAALELRGLVDRRGRLRANWLQRLEGLISVARSLDAQLGLDRQARAVNFTERLSAALARKGETS